MNLAKKKTLAAKTLKVGEKRIVFNKERLSDIKEAITKQDILDLFKDGAIFVREVRGRKKIEGRNWRRRPGSIKHKKKKGKTEYMRLTRKLRAYVKQLLYQNKITKEKFITLRKEIRSRVFKSKHHLKEVLLTQK